MNFLKKIISLTLLNFFLVLALVYIFNILPQPKAKVLTMNKAIIEKQNQKISISPTITIIFNSPVNSANKTQENIQVEQNTPQPTVSNVELSKCIISIDSQKYNVTELRQTHSGGDVFKCGADMTSDFYSRHDASYLPMMEKYRL